MLLLVTCQVRTSSHVPTHGISVFHYTDIPKYHRFSINGLYLVSFYRCRYCKPCDHKHFHISLCVNISIGSIPRRKYPLFKGRGYSKVTNVLGAATHHLRPQSARSRARVHGPLCEPPEPMASPISCAASCPRPRLDCEGLGEQGGLRSMPPSRQPPQTCEPWGPSIWGLRASSRLDNISEIGAQ